MSNTIFYNKTCFGFDWTYRKLTTHIAVESLLLSTTASTAVDHPSKTWTEYRIQILPDEKTGMFRYIFCAILEKKIYQTYDWLPSPIYKLPNTVFAFFLNRELWEKVSWRGREAIWRYTFLCPLFFFSPLEASLLTFLYSVERVLIDSSLHFEQKKLSRYIHS